MFVPSLFFFFEQESIQIIFNNNIIKNIIIR